MGGNGNKGTENVYFVDCGDKCLANPLELGPACKELSKKQNDVTKDSSICVVYIDKKTNKPDFAKPFPKQLPLYYTSDTGVEYEAEIQTSCSLPLISPWATVVVESGKGVKVPTVPINLETGKDLPSNIVLAFTGGITTGAYRAAKRAERYNEAGFELDPEKCGCECTPTSPPTPTPSAPTPTPPTPTTTTPTPPPTNPPTDPPTDPPTNPPTNPPTTAPTNAPTRPPSTRAPTTPPTIEPAPPLICNITTAAECTTTFDDATIPCQDITGENEPVCECGGFGG